MLISWLVLMIVSLSVYVSEQGKICSGSYLSDEEKEDTESDIYKYYDMRLSIYVMLIALLHTFFVTLIVVGGIIYGIVYAIKGPEYFKKKELFKEN